MSLDSVINFSGDRVLYCVLNWGLGHATRSIPVINRLLHLGNEVLLASDGDALQLLKQEYPTLKAFALSGYDFHYSHASMSLNVLLQGPKLLGAIRSEKKECEELVRKYQPTRIFSDHRYGCYHKELPSYLIAHQLRIATENMMQSKIATKMNLRLMEKFDEIWIPDHADRSLAGTLSEPLLNKPKKYIGALTRFVPMDLEVTRDILVILSGPEPARTKFEDKVLAQLLKTHYKITLVRGKPSSTSNPPQNSNIEIVSYMTAEALNRAICSSRLVICRSGYSSIMDLVALDSRAILIPTPGLPEQEYLGEVHKGMKRFSVLEQASMNLSEDVETILSY